MSGFSSLTQSALNGVTNVKGQSRILESEIRMDASRGVVIKRKQEKLEKLKTQEETVMKYLTNAMAQDAENTKKFMDSIEETNKKIREEAEKAAEESPEKTEPENNTNVNQNNADGSQNAAETGGIVDIVIPSTVVNGELSNSEKNTDEQTASLVNVSV